LRWPAHVRYDAFDTARSRRDVARAHSPGEPLSVAIFQWRKISQGHDSRAPSQFRRACANGAFARDSFRYSGNARSLRANPISIPRVHECAVMTMHLRLARAA